MKLFFTLFHALIMLIVTSIIIFLETPFLLLPKYTRMKWSMKLVTQRWAKLLCWYLNIKIKTLGIENLPALSNPQRRFMIISNHLSLIDIPVLVSQTAVILIMRKEVSQNPFGWGGMIAGALSFDRESRKAQLKLMKDVVVRLNDNFSLHFFPEGTRSEDGELLPFKRGLLAILYKEKVPILPMAHFGNHKIIPKGQFVLNRNQRSILAFNEMLDPKDFPDRDAFIEACRSSVEQALLQAKTEYEK